LDDIAFIASYSDLILSDTDQIVKLPMVILESFITPLLGLVGVVMVGSLVIIIFNKFAR
jgi:hypothetical protein